MQVCGAARELRSSPSSGSMQLLTAALHQRDRHHAAGGHRAGGHLERRVLVDLHGTRALEVQHQDTLAHSSGQPLHAACAAQNRGQ
jgi:hypothetical protein